MDVGQVAAALRDPALRPPPLEEQNARAELRARYWLNDQCQKEPSEVHIIVVNPHLAEQAGASGETEINTMHGDPDGIVVYTFKDDDPGGTWRVLWTASDSCGPRTPHRRTHDEQRMLVANRKKDRSRDLEVWYHRGCGEGCDLVDVPFYSQWVGWAFENPDGGAGVRYRQHEATLNHPYVAGVHGGVRLTGTQQQQAVERHVVTVCRAVGEALAVRWAGVAYLGNPFKLAGDRANPVRVRIVKEAVEEDVPHDGCTIWGATNVIIHELGHAAGVRKWWGRVALECTEEVHECVMYHRLADHHYRAWSSPWGNNAQHIRMHRLQIRKFLGYE